ncbi:hypothetical protein Hanom_Chr10g00899991 [Helianthus anomalus]
MSTRVMREDPPRFVFINYNLRVLKICRPFLKEVAVLTRFLMNGSIRAVFNF